jgi:hypothetical protein
MLEIGPGDRDRVDRAAGIGAHEPVRTVAEPRLAVRAEQPVEADLGRAEDPEAAVGPARPTPAPPELVTEVHAPPSGPATRPSR